MEHNKEKYMAEFFPFTLDPEMNYDDIAALVALALSIASVWLTTSQWRQRKKSEEIKIAREHMERINMNKKKLEEFVDTSRDQREKEVDKMVTNGAKLGDVIVERIMIHIHFTELVADVCSEVDQFRYLITEHEIKDKNVINRYRPQVFQVLARLEVLCESELNRGRGQSSEEDDRESIKKYLYSYFDKIRESKKDWSENR
jgi:hypothetical protein